MTNEEFIAKIRRRIAQTYVGASALRNQGGRILGITQQYLEQSVDLDEFFQKMGDETTFCDFLDDHTERLLNNYPDGAKSWGAARKALNLYFRDLVYNKFIADKYGLPTDFAEFNLSIHHLEIPLDRDSGTRIHAASVNRDEFARWNRIKRLQKPASDAFQAAAQILAKQENVARVHLDVEYWRSAEKE